MGLGKLQAFLMGVFGGAVSGQGATTGQALVKQANGSWAPGTVSASDVSGATVTITATAGDLNLSAQAGDILLDAASDLSLDGGSTATLVSGSHNLVIASGVGIKIGTATSQLVGFYNATPVNQPDAVADAAGGATVDTQARTQLNLLLARMRELGLIAT